MLNRTWITIAAVAAALALGGRAVFGDRPSEREEASARASNASEPRPASEYTAARELVFAQPFQLSEPYAFEWTAESVMVTSGWLLVLQDDPAACEPSQEAEPVLYGGALPLERINTGIDSGRVVAVLPSARGADGHPSLDLAATEFYRGRADFPERVTNVRAAAELDAARVAGVRPFEAAALSAATRAELLEFPTRDELMRHGAGLVLQFAPRERELAESMLVPRVR